MYPEENACKASPYPTPHRSVSDAVSAKQTEMDGIAGQARVNRDRIYSVAERLSAYIDRQVGPRPTAGENDVKEQPVGRIFDINLTLRNQSKALDHIESMLSHLEEIG